MIKKNDVLKSKDGNVFNTIEIIDVIGDKALYNVVNGKSVYVSTLSELERDYVIPKEEWRPYEGQPVFLINMNGEVYYADYRSDWHLDAINFLGGYPTKELAEQALAEIKEKIKK